MSRGTDFQQCGILTSADSDKPVQSPCKHTPKESSNAYTFVLAFSQKPEFRIVKYFEIA